MKVIKGCVNQSCEAKKKQIKYKSSEMYCSKCGQPLSYVCKKCYTVLPDASNAYCFRHSEEKKDQKDKVKKGAGKAGGIALAAVVGSLIPVVGKFIKKD